MGLIHVTTIVRNPIERERSWEGLFLVDTGATDSLVPKQILETIGLVPSGQRAYCLADGNEIEMDITVGEMEVMGRIVGVTIVMGDENAAPLLGVTALESAGIEVDPHNETLKTLPAVSLRGGFRPKPLQ